MKTTKEQIGDILLNNFKGTDIYYNDILAVLENDDIFFDTEWNNEIEIKEAIEELVQDNSVLDADVIYYSVAMKYLAENDQSLSDSLEIANELGYTVDMLSSEVLASLLKSRNNQEEFYETMDSVESDLEELFNNESEE